MVLRVPVALLNLLGSLSRWLSTIKESGVACGGDIACGGDCHRMAPPSLCSSKDLEGSYRNVEDLKALVRRTQDIFCLCLLRRRLTSKTGRRIEPHSDYRLVLGWIPSYPRRALVIGVRNSYRFIAATRRL